MNFSKVTDYELVKELARRMDESASEVGYNAYLPFFFIVNFWTPRALSLRGEKSIIPHLADFVKGKCAQIFYGLIPKITY